MSTEDRSEFRGWRAGRTVLPCCSHRHHADFRAGFRRASGLATLRTAGPARDGSQRWQLAARFAALLTRCAVLRCSESRSGRFSSRLNYTSSGVRAPRTARGIFSLCSRTYNATRRRTAAALSRVFRKSHACFNCRQNASTKEFEEMMSICASTRCRELESRSSWSTSPKFSEPPSVTTSTFAVAEASGRPFDASMRSSPVVARAQLLAHPPSKNPSELSMTACR